VRTIDFGTASAVRSQSVWHALAASMRAGDEPVLSFVRPEEPYVCLGYHRDLAEVDTDYCDAAGLSVMRRMVGGGPVYLDSDQHFFQVTVPAASVPGRRSAALAALLSPAVEALRSLAVPVELDPFGEITLGEAKVCGHGAGQIDDGVTVVGNLITGFDHDRATRVVRLSDRLRDEVHTLMQAYVMPTPVDVQDWKQAMVSAYSRHLGGPVRSAAMTLGEESALRGYDRLLVDPEFVAGTRRPVRPVRTIKIRAGVWALEYHPDPTDEQQHIVMTVAGGVVERASGHLPAGVVGLDLVRAAEVFGRTEVFRPLAAALATAQAEVAA
jgi:lipoate---protein ligase